MLGLYIHVPFCAHHCGYCDFASLAGADHLADRYLDALDRDEHPASVSGDRPAVTRRCQSRTSPRSFTFAPWESNNFTISG